MSSSNARISALLRKSLNGELIDTQFYLFSARSKREGQAVKPRALFSNDEALTAGSEYFSSLHSEGSLNDPTLVELQDYYTCEEAISLNDYGYASDSDLEDDDDEVEEGEEETNATVLDNLPLELRVSVSEDRRMPDPAQMASSSIKDFGAKGIQRIIPNRRIMVTDTAFKTWQALLYYLYTGEIVFASLRSQPNRTAKCGSLDTPPPCSPKSMYRLACKIKHVALQEEALVAIRSSLTEHNIVKELSLSMVSRYPPILEMEVESLFQHIATPTVINDFPTLMKRIAGADIPHGADILIQLHQKMLRQLYPGTLSPSHVPPIVDLKQCDMLGADAKGQPGGEALSTPLVENSDDSVLKTFKFTFCEGFPVGGGSTEVAAPTSSPSSELAPAPLTPDQKEAEIHRASFLRREVARLEASKVKPPYGTSVLEIHARVGALEERIARTNFSDQPERLPHATKLSTGGKVASENLKELTNMIVDLLIGQQDAKPINVTVSFPSTMEMKKNSIALQGFVTENQFSMRSPGKLTYVITV